jgi:hypothetical protein
LKRGFALELRYGWRQRPTRDIDLRVSFTPADALTQLRMALTGSVIRDHFAFELSETVAELPGAPGGALRARVVARLAGTEFAAFHIDLASGNVLVGTPDLLDGSSLLDFANIAPIRFPIYPVAQQLAEKLHAYTLTRAEENTRVKDLVDLVSRRPRLSYPPRRQPCLPDDMADSRAPPILHHESFSLRTRWGRAARFAQDLGSIESASSRGVATLVHMICGSTGPGRQWIVGTRSWNRLIGRIACYRAPPLLEVADGRVANWHGHLPEEQPRTQYCPSGSTSRI